MQRSSDRRRGPGRRAEDQRRAEVALLLEQDLTAVSDLVGAIRADPALPEETTRRLSAVDRELSRIIQVTREAAPALSREAADAHQLASHLTRREWQCLDLLVKGLSTDAMADALTVSTTTVRTHVQALLAKLGVHSRLQAVALTTRTALLASAPRTGVDRRDGR
ncbi:response regulator transcription factor [Umezawaea endophytica]|uniref:Helix-turn-helix transcriptional regulator n=1 Tax=Umezawaea endophytica TaxID=1654476 RepID=A0A9X2VIY5_9PSEU|nr:helix-turn-helix transcriptional regulator [Umezawaea endophytica]MCS7477486.1 helix-turn-helix transcriptional regulator [Umezawaea endophytica]